MWRWATVCETNLCLRDKFAVKYCLMCIKRQFGTVKISILESRVKLCLELSPDILSYCRVNNKWRKVKNYFTVQTHRYVTPSLAELGGRHSVPEMSENTLMVTRVPGAGAELLVLILQRLQGLNSFKHIRMPPGDDNLLTTLQQVSLKHSHEEHVSRIYIETFFWNSGFNSRNLNFYRRRNIC